MSLTEKYGDAAHVGLGFIAGILSRRYPWLSAFISILFFDYQVYDWIHSRDNIFKDLGEYAVSLVISRLLVDHVC